MRNTRSSTTALSVLGFRARGWVPNTKISPPEYSARSPASVENQTSRESTSRLENDFYRARLQAWDDRQEQRRAARTSLHEEELTWMSTVQDARFALLVSPETGFDTWGIETAVAEILPGWHTGRHIHGEEAIYVIGGRGFIAVDGVRYDIYPGTTVGVPYGAEHQLFNTGSETLSYLSATAYPLERYLGLYRLEQVEECGPSATIPQLPVSKHGYDQKGRRIRLLWEEAFYRDGSVGLRAWLEARIRGGVDLRQRYVGGAPAVRNKAARLASGIGHHSAWVQLMGGPRKMDFSNRLALISGFLIEDPGAHSGRHAHMEAIIYVLKGHGHSVVDGEKIPWRPGSSLHVQGPQVQHQHFNTGSEPAFMLRIASGLRPYIEKSVKEVFPFLWFEAHGRGGEESTGH
ncbi:MAG: cupin domain-containing protein [Nitrospirae bacterium]|nr:cupin domain-containing protein [Nitrospirota bacterium]